MFSLLNYNNTNMCTVIAMASRKICKAESTKVVLGNSLQPSKTTGFQEAYSGLSENLSVIILEVKFTRILKCVLADYCRCIAMRAESCNREQDEKKVEDKV